MISRSHTLYFGQFSLCEIMFITVKKPQNHIESMFILGSLHCLSNNNPCTFGAVCIYLIFVYGLLVSIKHGHITEKASSNEITDTEILSLGEFYSAGPHRLSEVVNEDEWVATGCLCRVCEARPSLERKACWQG